MNKTRHVFGSFRLDKDLYDYLYHISTQPRGGTITQQINDIVALWVSSDKRKKKRGTS